MKGRQTLGFRHPYGLDHPTWPEPGAFYYDSEQHARDAVVRTYGPDSGHVIVKTEVL